MPDEAKDGGDYEVGYCRPPVHSRFQPGASGNPSGRPKGAQNFRTLLDQCRTSATVPTSGWRAMAISRIDVGTPSSWCCRRCLAARPPPAAVRRQHSAADVQKVLGEREAAPDGHRPALRRRIRSGLARRCQQVEGLERQARRQGWARSPTTTAPTGARPGRCSPATSPTSGTPACAAWSRHRAWSRPASRSARRSSGPRTGFVLSRGHYHWQHEPCWYAVRKGTGHWTGDRKQSTLWADPEAGRRPRPATARRSRSSA